MNDEKISVAPTLDQWSNWRCGECGKILIGRVERCPKCGRAVKWDEPPKEET